MKTSISQAFRVTCGFLPLSLLSFYTLKAAGPSFDAASRGPDLSESVRELKEQSKSFRGQLPQRSEAELRRELQSAVAGSDYALMGISEGALALASQADKLTITRKLVSLAQAAPQGGDGGTDVRGACGEALARVLGSAPDAASFDWLYYRSNPAELRRAMQNFKPVKQQAARHRASAVPGDWAGYLKYLDTVAEVRTSGLNRIEFLIDGEAALKPGIAAIEGAKRTIHLEVFQLQGDEIGIGMGKLLEAKAAAGVRVRVLLDEHGTRPNESDSEMVKELIAGMRKGGVEVRIRKTPFLASHLDHRKVLVIDGDVGFTGGMNIGNSYQKDWHDQQTMIMGPAVAELQDAFLEQWSAVGGAVDRNGPGLYPGIVPPADGSETRVVTHRGGAEDQNIKAAYMRAFATSQRSIRIANPYFVDGDIVKALGEAARRGVRVQVILPEDNDMPIVQRASRAFYPDMLASGVEVYEYQGRMAHEKVAVIDGLWSTMGSSNLDARSLSNNDELNLVVMDARLARYIERFLFEVDVPRSRRFTSYTPTTREKLARRLLEELL